MFHSDHNNQKYLSHAKLTCDELSCTNFLRVNLYMFNNDVFVIQARITELSFLLINFPHADILALRRQGRFLYDTYFSSARYLLEGMLSVVRTRLQIPPVAV